MALAERWPRFKQAALWVTHGAFSGTIAFSAAALEYYAVLILPPYLDRTNGDFLYPWVAYGKFTLAQLAAIVGLIAFIGLIVTFRTLAKSVAALVISLSFFACTSSFLGLIWWWFDSPVIEIGNSIQFEAHVYQLAKTIVSTGDSGHFAWKYLVFECDSAGLVCHRYYTITLDDRDESFNLFADDTGLSLQIGTENYHVFYNQDEPEANSS